MINTTFPWICPFHKWSDFCGQYFFFIILTYLFDYLTVATKYTIFHIIFSFNFNEIKILIIKNPQESYDKIIIKDN